MITFLITKDNIEKTIECSLEDSILSLKERIIKEYSLTCEYIDIDFFKHDNGNVMGFIKDERF